MRLHPFSSYVIPPLSYATPQIKLRYTYTIYSRENNLFYSSCKAYICSGVNRKLFHQVFIQYSYRMFILKLWNEIAGSYCFVFGPSLLQSKRSCYLGGFISLSAWRYSSKRTTSAIKFWRKVECPFTARIRETIDYQPPVVDSSVDVSSVFSGGQHASAPISLVADFLYRLLSLFGGLKLSGLSVFFSFLLQKLSLNTCSGFLADSESVNPCQGFHKWPLFQF